MGRNSTVESHPQVERINSMLDDGVSYAEVSTRFGLSVSAVGRYAISRKSTLAKISNAEPNITDVVPRLVEAADHAQEFRRNARRTGSAVQQSRAIKVETDVLSRLLAELGVTDTAITETLAEARALVLALGAYVRAEPLHARILLDHLAEDAQLKDLGAALTAQTGKTA